MQCLVIGKDANEGWGQNNPDSCPVSGTPILQFNNNTMDSSPPLEGGDWPTPSRRTSRMLRKYTDFSIREISRRTGVPKSTAFEHIRAPTSRTKQKNGTGRKHKLDNKQSTK